MNTSLNGPKVTEDQVVRVLRRHRMDYSKWGTPPSYTLNDLLEKLHKEQVFLVEDEGKLILRINAGNILPYYEDDEADEIFELYEEKQVHNGGTIVQRHHLRGVTGILLRGERPEDGAKRELIEELGQTEPKLKNHPIATTHWKGGTLIRHGHSRKWPGLHSVTSSVGFKFRMPSNLYHKQYVEAIVDPTTRQTLRTSFFGWRICTGM